MLVIKGVKNVMIACGAGVALSIENAASDMSATPGACALSFAGEGNTLTLYGSSDFKSGDNAAGIRAAAGTVIGNQRWGQRRGNGRRQRNRGRAEAQASAAVKL